MIFRLSLISVSLQKSALHLQFKTNQWFLNFQSIDFLEVKKVPFILPSIGVSHIIEEISQGLNALSAVRGKLNNTTIARPKNNNKLNVFNFSKGGFSTVREIWIVVLKIFGESEICSHRSLIRCHCLALWASETLIRHDFITFRESIFCGNNMAVFTWSHILGPPCLA